MDFARVMDLIIGHMVARGSRWAVAGGLAMQGHGLARTTHDLDFVTEAAGQPALVGFMESLGYETVYVSPGFSNHVHADPALGGVDFIYVDAATAERLFPQCREVPWTTARTVRVPLPQHLIAMKVHAMKNDPSRTFREMADIQYLMTLPGVDRASVRWYFEKAGLVERYEEILRVL